MSRAKAWLPLASGLLLGLGLGLAAVLARLPTPVALLVAAAVAPWPAWRRWRRLRAELVDLAQRIAEAPPHRPPSTILFTPEAHVLTAPLAERFDRDRQRFEGAERRRAELAALLDAIQEGVVVLDPDERIRRCNAAARRCLGLPEGCVGARLAEVLRWPRLTAVLEDHARERRPRSFEAQRHGRLWQVRIHGFELPGVGPATLILCDDVTELRRLERVRRDFVANLSHELRTPIAVARGWLETLRETPDLTPAEREQALERTAEQIERLERLAEDVLALARIESLAEITETLPTEPVRLDTLAAQLLEQWRGAAVQRRIRLRAEVPAELAWPLDAEAIGLALANLLDNAVKYTDPGDEVVLRAYRDPEGNLVLEVEDHGPGVPLEAQPRLFERFFRVDPSRSRATGGTGLGLAIVKHVARLHGGEAWVRSQPGRGARFGLTLPHRGEAPATTTEAPVAVRDELD